MPNSIDLHKGIFLHVIPIRIIVPCVYPYTALPSMMVSFWESHSNKRKFIDCAYEYYLEHPMKAELAIVCSGYFIPKEDT